MVAEPAVVWGIFLRLVGAVQCIALVSLGSQIRALAGPRGATPFGLMLARVRVDYRSWPSRLRRLPTLCWLTGASDGALLALAGAGAVCGAALACGGGGAWTPCAAFAAWACLLSLDEAADLKFPWDSLLLELSALCVLLPPLREVGGGGGGGGGGDGGGGSVLLLPLLPVLSARSLADLGLAAGVTPHPWLAWSFRFLLFRLMFGFGKLKFTGCGARDATYIKSFLVGIPLPTPLGHWLYRRLPDGAWVAALAGMFLVEIVAPFLLFCRGAPRVGAAAAIAGLQAGIQATGNFGHFNVLTAVLCIPMLDAGSSLFDAGEAADVLWWGMDGGGGGGGGGGGQQQGLLPPWAVALYVLVHSVGALVLLPFNSWCTLGCLSWPMIAAPPFWFVELFETLAARLRLIHAYGVFPPNSGPPLRFAQVIEGSADGGATWEAYEWAHGTSTAASAPRFVAPHHPRLDFQVFYTSLGADSENLTATASRASPYVRCYVRCYVRYYVRYCVRYCVRYSLLATDLLTSAVVLSFSFFLRLTD